MRALERGAIKELESFWATRVDVDTGRRHTMTRMDCADDFAGVERDVLTIPPRIARQRCDVTVVRGHPRRTVNGLRPKGVQWCLGGRLLIAFARLIRLGRFAIFHVPMTQEGLVGSLYPPVARANVVATGDFPRRRESSSSARVFAALAPLVVGEQLAISEYVAQSIDGLSIVVRPGVSDIADPPPLDIRGSVVLVLRHLAPDRHTKVTIEKVVGSDFADLGWRLEIAGPGEVESEMREPTDRSGFRESCQFVGQSFNVGARYRRALIFFAPRPNEPYDLALLEAVNYGLPVVARRGGGHVETVGSVAVTSFSTSGDLDTAAGMLEEPATDPTLWTQYGGELS